MSAVREERDELKRAPMGMKSGPELSDHDDRSTRGASVAGRARTVVPGWSVARGGTLGLLLPALLVLALVTPVVLFGLDAKHTVDVDLGQRRTQDRLATAQVAASHIERALVAGAQSLRLISTRLLLLDALRRSDRTELRRHVADLHAASPRYFSAAAFDERGTLLASSLRTPEVDALIGTDFSSRDYFIGGMASADLYVSDVFPPAAAAPALVGISLAVREGGEALGLLLVTTAPADVVATLAPFHEATLK